MTQLISLESLTKPNGTPNGTHRAARAAQPNATRVPDWLKVKTGKARQTVQTGALLDELKIVTVCEEARCDENQNGDPVESRCECQ